MRLGSLLGIPGCPSGSIPHFTCDLAVAARIELGPVSAVGRCRSSLAETHHTAPGFDLSSPHVTTPPTTTTTTTRTLRPTARSCVPRQRRHGACTARRGHGHDSSSSDGTTAVSWRRRCRLQDVAPVSARHDRHRVGGAVPPRRARVYISPGKFFGIAIFLGWHFFWGGDRKVVELQHFV